MDYEIFELGDYTLQSGTVLNNAFLAYKTYGTLNAEKNNVILYPTALGDTHRSNEWLIGEGMALDPNKYFIVVPNLLGNGLSSSPSNSETPLDKNSFPLITIYDNVRMQHHLMTYKLGIKKIALVTGWSLGAMQTFEWGAAYPDMVQRIAPFNGTAKTWPHAYAFFEGVKAPLEADASTGLRAVGRIYAGWGFSHAFYRKGCYKELGYYSLDEFITGFWEQNFLTLDPYNLLTMFRTGQHADISNNSLYNGDFNKALHCIKAQACIMPGATDLYFTHDDNKFEVDHMPNARLHPIDSIWGHFAGRGIHQPDITFINDALNHLLSIKQ
ncbi:alpha/beta fold hydrolase [Paenibacillus sp. SYP-B3998]|uniref:Alpha/beta fold hydrolase n=1 Tax=Paenibacillus sp. SYP-B3998 TaxID=2678564 RepID=A0A6G4A596_9BACL|nr:alpha/beta fold hydrolase [Paenibacillus sp. SYP-B3998]NEW08979.1 alpha/beta fold hydrolase [Paenibacillus sp. SYP-B3998]